MKRNKDIDNILASYKAKQYRITLPKIRVHVVCSLSQQKCESILNDKRIREIRLKLGLIFL